MKIKIIVSYIFIMIVFSLSGCLTTEYNLATERQETYIYSTDREVSIGNSISHKIEAKYPLADDKDMQSRISEIGKKLADVSDRQDIIYYFKVIKEEQANAIALPGGFIYISDSLVNEADSDDEIAAVLAHEIGHITARHSVKQMQGSYLYNFLRILTARLNKDDPYLNRGVDYAFGSLIIQYSQQDELEADRLSVKYMKNAGFDPDALILMLDKIDEIDRQRALRRFTYFRTHPPVATRKGVIRQSITGCIDFEGYINRPETVLY
ncbi:MAG: M48 family metalloprotease [Candidatus Omnitrophota bacterium]